MREKIKLESSAGTGHFYTTTKNKKTMPEKMTIKKFDPVARKHVDYKETKLKQQRYFNPRGGGDPASFTSPQGPAARGPSCFYAAPMLTRTP